MRFSTPLRLGHDCDRQQWAADGTDQNDHRNNSFNHGTAPDLSPIGIEQSLYHQDSLVNSTENNGRTRLDLSI
jgi:hypothetical protein